MINRKVARFCIGFISGIATGWAAAASAELTIARQGSFFIGGTARYAESITAYSTPEAEIPREGQITTGQMYVRYQTPAGAKRIPLILIHGGGLSGQAYETTPDGRMGWDEYFLRSGRSVYLVDQVGRGRSGFDGSLYNAIKLSRKSPADLPPIGHISHETAWTLFRIGPVFGVPFSDTQFPTSAINEFYKSLIPDLTASLLPKNPTHSNLAELARLVGGAILVGHSQSFMFPQFAALVDSRGIRGIISLESIYACDSRSAFTQQDYRRLAQIPMLIVFGDHLEDAAAPLASRWTRAMQQCQEFAETVREQGGDVTFVHLPRIGIRGNTHMLMLDKNNLIIADMLARWMDEHTSIEKASSTPRL